MHDEPLTDPDLEGCMVAAVERGEFGTVAQARADFCAKLDESIAQADRGELFDVEQVRRDLHERYSSPSRAAG